MIQSSSIVVHHWQHFINDGTSSSLAPHHHWRFIIHGSSHHSSFWWLITYYIHLHHMDGSLNRWLITSMSHHINGLSHQWLTTSMAHHINGSPHQWLNTSMAHHIDGSSHWWLIISIAHHWWLSHLLRHSYNNVKFNAIAAATTKLSKPSGPLIKRPQINYLHFTTYGSYEVYFLRSKIAEQFGQSKTKLSTTYCKSSNLPLCQFRWVL